MGKIYKIVAYVSDPNDEFETWEDYADCVMENYRHDCLFRNIASETSKSFEWGDDIDINQLYCPIETFEKYFNAESDQ